MKKSFQVQCGWQACVLLYMFAVALVLYSYTQDILKSVGKGQQKITISMCSSHHNFTKDDFTFLTKDDLAQDNERLIGASNAVIPNTIQDSSRPVLPTNSNTATVKYKKKIQVQDNIQLVTMTLNIQ
jgi:hypothetical protein